MSKDLTIKVKGLKEAQTAMDKKPRAVTDAIGAALRESADIVEGEAKLALTSGPTRAIRTGRLRASIGGGGFSGGSIAKGSGIEITPVRAIIGPTVNYAIHVHEGTTRMRARPFMAVARKTAEQKVIDAFEHHLSTVL